MELNSADLVWTHFAVANFLQHAKILDDNHTVLVLNRVFLRKSLSIRFTLSRVAPIMLDKSVCVIFC